MEAASVMDVISQKQAFIICTASFAFCLLLQYVVNPMLTSAFMPKYKLLCYSDKLDWNSRVTSTIHAIIITVNCLYVVIEPAVWMNPAMEYSRVLIAMCLICIGYILADTLVIFMHWHYIGSIPFLVHHAATTTACAVTVITSWWTWFTALRLLAEFSTTFVNLRWFLQKLDIPKTSRIAVWNGLTLVASFFACRIMLIPVYWLSVYNLIYSPTWLLLNWWKYFGIACPIFLDTLNIYWFGKLVRGAVEILWLRKGNTSRYNAGYASKLKMCEGDTKKDA
ncbi:PREDICTED: transmembrane protein 56-B-like [Priapulus caudatus]|uniref:Transmembrane protein 56-B-like n=1 Tax=Priapulus caudatus TaxID=37621 RepID=A0ABM1E2D9_PRICU|nr:PREDICTED: transmembrane protein 56-B-like [Priapulus caudatus]